MINAVLDPIALKHHCFQQLQTRSMFFIKANNSHYLAFSFLHTHVDSKESTSGAPATVPSGGGTTTASTTTTTAAPAQVTSYTVSGEITYEDNANMPYVSALRDRDSATFRYYEQSFCEEVRYTWANKFKLWFFFHLSFLHFKIFGVMFFARFSRKGSFLDPQLENILPGGGQLGFQFGTHAWTRVLKNTPKRVHCHGKIHPKRVYHFLQKHPFLRVFRYIFHQTTPFNAFLLA